MGMYYSAQVTMGLVLTEAQAEELLNHIIEKENFDPFDPEEFYDADDVIDALEAYELDDYLFLSVYSVDTVTSIMQYRQEHRGFVDIDFYSNDKLFVIQANNSILAEHIFANQTYQNMESIYQEIKELINGLVTLTDEEIKQQTGTILTSTYA